MYANKDAQAEAIEIIQRGQAERQEGVIELPGQNPVTRRFLTPEELAERRKVPYTPISAAPTQGRRIIRNLGQRQAQPPADD